MCVRSSSRVGDSDFGVNAKRLNWIANELRSKGAPVGRTHAYHARIANAMLTLADDARFAAPAQAGLRRASAREACVRSRIARASRRGLSCCVSAGCAWLAEQSRAIASTHGRLRHPNAWA